MRDGIISMMGLLNAMVLHASLVRALDGPGLRTGFQTMSIYRGKDASCQAQRRSAPARDGALEKHLRSMGRVCYTASLKEGKE